MEESDIEIIPPDLGRGDHFPDRGYHFPDRGAPSPARISGHALARRRVAELLREKRRQKRREEARKQAEADKISKLSQGYQAYAEKTRQRVEAQRAAMAEEAEKQARGGAVHQLEKSL